MDAVTAADRRGRRRGNGRPLRVLAIAFTVAAIVKELRLPGEERTWHGSAATFIPYDFRKPTFARVRERLWSPESPVLLAPTIFGVGWTLNLGRVITLVRGLGRDRAPDVDNATGEGGAS